MNRARGGASRAAMLGLVLIVEDEPLSARAMARAVKMSGYEATIASDGDQALEALRARRYDAVLCDLGLPGIDGLTLVRQIAGMRVAPVIVVTGRSDMASAVEAMQAGAEDYLTKPLSIALIARTLERVIVPRNPTADAGERERSDVEIMVETAGSEPMRQLLALAERCAASRAHAVIVGEAGTGKEAVARFVHQRSARADAPFLRVHMGSLVGAPEEVLFGRAASGGRAALSGLVADAHGGTLLLDCVEEIPNHVQAQLLRVIETGRVYPVGGAEPRSVDVRFLATTTLVSEEDLLLAGMRMDLYYRLAGVVVRVPPLRRRTGDVEPLARAVLERIARATGRPAPPLSSAAIELLEAYPWPGNLRELRNVLERAALASPDGIERKDLELAGLALDTSAPRSRESDSPASAPTEPAGAPAIEPLRVALSRAERSAIELALEHTGGDVAAAARALEITETLLVRKMRTLGLVASRGGSPPS